MQYAILICALYMPYTNLLIWKKSENKTNTHKQPTKNVQKKATSVRCPFDIWDELVAVNDGVKGDVTVLRFVQVFVDAVFQNKFIMSAHFFNLAFVDDKDLICLSYG